MKKFRLVICVLFTNLFLNSAFASLVTLDFENLPLTHYFYSGNTNIGNYYDGVSFGSNVTILDKTIFGSGYNSGGYPPHSGNSVAFSISNPVIDAYFDTDTDYVSLWYTAYSNLTLEAYDRNGSLLASSIGAFNYGTNSMLELSIAGISRVAIHDSGNFYTIDDFSFNKTVGVPEPAGFALLGLGLLGLFMQRKLLSAKLDSTTQGTNIYPHEALI